MASGLLMELEDHNCWTIAEAAGHHGPHRLQHLLSRAVWDDQQVLDIAAAWAAGHLDDGEGVLIVDETADEKSSSDAASATPVYRPAVVLPVLDARAGPAVRLIAVAVSRWRIEADHQLAKQSTGPEQDAGPIPVTIPELLRLLRDTVIPPPRHDRAHRLHWSDWRRRHQHRARRAHQRWNAYAETTP
jgi:DDE superfamily endonuclease